MAWFGKKKTAEESADGKNDSNVPENGADGNGHGSGDGGTAVGSSDDDGQYDRRHVSDANKARASQWFQRAKTVADTRNYDYAIECYISGLEHWPEAIEAGHMKIRLVATQRHAAGKKKPTTGEKLKHPFSKKDALRNMLNAEYLWAKDTGNLVYMEAFFKNAIKSGCFQTAYWFGQIYYDAAVSEKKPDAKRLLGLRALYEELAESLSDLAMPDESCEAYKHAIDALDIVHRIKPEDSVVVDEMRALATIVRGRFDRADTFKESVRDKDAQKDLQDVQRLVQTDDRIDELIVKARKAWADNPQFPAKIMALTELLCKRERTEDENEAIEILEQAFADTDEQNYRFRQVADEIRMKQLRRTARELATELKADPDNEALKNEGRVHTAEQRRIELEIFEERVKAYPTDLGMLYEYGRRLFNARMYDEAIPVFQKARQDPKRRLDCGMYIGRCFFEKKIYTQAVAALREVVEGYEIAGDDRSKEQHYWLARALEAYGETSEAMKVFGQVLQWDYNYRDVRQRMDKLSQED
jgi:tetratricopeptide (TPR) repeat protein